MLNMRIRSSMSIISLMYIALRESREVKLALMI